MCKSVKLLVFRSYQCCLGALNQNQIKTEKQKKTEDDNCAKLGTQITTHGTARALCAIPMQPNWWAPP